MEAVLLSAALGPDQAVEAAAGVGVEEDVEERDVARLGRPDRLGRQLEERAAPVVGCCAATQVAKVWLSQLAAFGAIQGSSSGTSRAIRSSRARACSKSASASGEIARARSRTSPPGRRSAPRCRRCACRHLDQVASLVVGREGARPRARRRAPPAAPGSGRSTGRRPRPPCRRRSPRSAAGRRPARAPRPPAAPPRPRHPPRRHQSRQPGADDRDVGFELLGHRPRLRPSALPPARRSRAGG